MPKADDVQFYFRHIQWIERSLCWLPKERKLKNVVKNEANL